MTYSLTPKRRKRRSFIGSATVLFNTQKGAKKHLMTHFKIPDNFLNTSYIPWQIKKKLYMAKTKANIFFSFM